MIGALRSQPKLKSYKADDTSYYGPTEAAVFESDRHRLTIELIEKKS